MKKRILSLALALALSAGLTALPAAAAEITAYDAVEAFETFARTSLVSPDPDYFTKPGGHFYVDLDGNGVPEMGAVYYASVGGEGAIGFYYVDADGSVKQIRSTGLKGEFTWVWTDFFYTSIGGSGGIIFWLCKRADGAYRLYADVAIYGMEDSACIVYDGAGSFKREVSGDRAYEAAGEQVFSLIGSTSAPDKFAFFPQPERPVPPLMAYASTQSVTVNGTPVEFQMYALKDENGNPTNYVKIRDVAYILNGTASQFEVGYYSNMVHLVKGWTYTSNGSEMRTPFSGDRACVKSQAQTDVNGTLMDLDAIVLYDDAGGGYTYYKLRDLGAALGFVVDWIPGTGIVVETPEYSGKI